MRARYIIASLLALFALLTLFDRFVLVELLLRRAALPLLVAFAVSIACIGVGALARRAEEADAPLDFLIGYPLFGTICFLVGLLNISAWTMVPLVVIGAIVGVIKILAGWKADRPASGRRDVWFAAVVVVIGCGFVWAQAPPASLDELAYHLAIPQTWVLEGRAIELPLSSHSYFPLGIESADLVGLVLLGATGGGVTSHFLHLFAAIATSLLIARRTESWLATAAIVTTPALAITAGWSLVDWPLAGLFVATFVALERDDPKSASAATAAGLLTKYTFLPFALLAWAIKRKRPHAIVLAGLVFFIRNAILTFNPFAPFLGGNAPHVSGFRELALADYVFEGAFIDEAIGASIVALPAFATGALALGCVGIAIALFFLAPSSRILVPYLVVPSLQVTASLKKKWFAVLIAICVVAQTFLVVWFTARGDAFSLLSGEASEVEYLRKQRSSYASIEWLNSQLPKNSRTLVIGTNELYWFAQPVRGGGNFDGPRVSRYLESLALREMLQHDRITHIAVIAAKIPTSNAQKQQERQTTLSPAAQRNLVAMLDRFAGTVTSRGDVTLFALR